MHSRRNIYWITILILILSLISMGSISAQKHRDRWKFEDYFPENYFYPEEDTRKNDKVGEMIFYMRLADIAPLKNIIPQKGETILRLNFFPEFAHPLFVEVRQVDNQSIQLTWKKGKAIRGYVEHATFTALTDTGWVDETERKYYGNDWKKGVCDVGSRSLTLSEWQQMSEILEEIDFLNYPHCINCSESELPYMLEYKKGRKSVSYYTECPNEKKENRLVKLLVSLVDTTYVDMSIYSSGKDVVAPAYPGGKDECEDFLRNAIQYPASAIRDLKEYDARVCFIVEKNGTIGMVVKDSYSGKDGYGFVDELIRVVKTMPKWEPATKNGEKVRCHKTLCYNYVLPKEIRPQYGHPILDTERDTSCWKAIETCYRDLLCDSFNAENNLSMGLNYYQEYLLENKSTEPPTYFDSLIYEGHWEYYFDRTPVVSHPGDSALKYFYKVMDLNPKVDMLTRIYMPVLQLEQQLHRGHNPLVELPFDTVEGVHLPYSYLIDWLKNGQLDAAKDYYGAAEDSYYWVGFYSNMMTGMKEPVIYNDSLQEDEAIFRFSIFPSFHASVAFRVTKSKKSMMLHWKILRRNYDPLKNAFFYTFKKEGHKRISSAKYECLLQYIENVHLDELPRINHVIMCDGAEWVIERKTNKGFKAHLTNQPGDDIKQLYRFLVKLTDKKLSYINEY